MSKMKTDFNLEQARGSDIVASHGTIQIIGTSPEYSPYVAIAIPGHDLYYVKDKDLERFAVNILKALKSKHLKQ